MTSEREHIKKKERILMDYYRGDGHTYTLRREWTHLPKETIYRMGYLKGEKFQDELKYYNTETFVRFHGWTVADPREHGNNMTSGTLADYLSSDAGNKFISGMTKISFAPIDTKMLLIAVPIIIGLFIGVFFFMGGH